MKLKFRNQEFQEAATAAVCDVFAGQPFHDPNVYTVDLGRIISVWESRQCAARGVS